MTLRSIMIAALLMGSPIIAGATETDEVALVSGPWITLGDVAQASGPLAKVRVAPSPAPGEMMALDPTYVAKIARENGVYFSDTRTAPIHVKRTVVAASPSAPAAQTVAYTKPAVPKPAQKILADRPSDKHFLVLTRDIVRGERVGAYDLSWAGPDQGVKPARGAPESMAELIGMEAKRTLRADRALRSADFKPAAIIRKGEPVTLVYQKGGVVLTVSGRALEDAAQNEPVRIMNNYSKRSIDAVASGAGEARVAEF